MKEESAVFISNQAALANFTLSYKRTGYEIA
jgi:hypothetical protein